LLQKNTPNLASFVLLCAFRLLAVGLRSAFSAVT